MNFYDSVYMIDSDRRPLLKSASTDVVISNHGPILGYSQIDVHSKLISIGLFTQSKFAIKNNCNDTLFFLNLLGLGLGLRLRLRLGLKVKRYEKYRRKVS